MLNKTFLGAQKGVFKGEVYTTRFVKEFRHRDDEYKLYFTY